MKEKATYTNSDCGRMFFEIDGMAVSAEDGSPAPAGCAMTLVDMGVDASVISDAEKIKIAARVLHMSADRIHVISQEVYERDYADNDTAANPNDTEEDDYDPYEDYLGEDDEWS